MEWLSANDCSGALRFGWLTGTASGLYAMAIIIILITSAPAYRPDVPLAFSERARKYIRRFLFVAQVLLLVLWCGAAYWAGRDLLPCYAQTLALGAVAIIAPFMLLLIFSAANWIGRSGAR